MIWKVCIRNLLEEYTLFLGIELGDKIIAISIGKFEARLWFKLNILRLDFIITKCIKKNELISFYLS